MSHFTETQRKFRVRLMLTIDPMYHTPAKLEKPVASSPQGEWEKQLYKKRLIRKVAFVTGYRIVRNQNNARVAVYRN